MTKQDYIKIIKIFGLAILCSLPFIIGMNMLIKNYVSYTVLVVLDAAIMLLSTLLGLIINDKRSKKIAQKRAELEAQQTKNNSKKD